MRIAYIIPGSGGSFYCENCVRDIDLVNAIRRLGHDVTVVPMYLPSFVEDSDAESSLPLFYGAINVYLTYRFPVLRKAPLWFTRLLDSPLLLNVAARKAGSTRAASLGELTLSLLSGEEGAHAEELERLVSVLRDDARPDIVHLSNALLLGLVRRIKQETALPVTCLLQDEDTWVDAMDHRSAKLVWGILTERSAEVDAFIPVSQYYADKMQEKMKIPKKRLHVTYYGIELEHYSPAALCLTPPVIGFLSRTSKPQGVELLAEAFIHLKRDKLLHEAKLRIAGGYTGDDRKFIKGLKKRFGQSGVLEDVEFVQGFDRENRIRFLRSLSVLSVPALSGQAFGSYLIEALALGVPVVQPELGGFPELIRETGGGIVYSPNSVEPLTEALRTLLVNPEKAEALGRQGSASVHKKFCIDTTAKRLLRIYSACLA